MPEAPMAQEALVSRWVDAFNARDLDGILACMDAEVRFFPLRLSRLGRFYRGHDGVRQWFDDHRHLTDPDIFEGIAERPLPPARPRFPEPPDGKA